jgi:hypothetical protein
MPGELCAIGSTMIAAIASGLALTFASTSATSLKPHTSVASIAASSIPFDSGARLPTSSRGLRTFRST